MIRKIILPLLLLAVVIAGCKKVSDSVAAIKEKLIDGYWSDLNDIVIKVDGTEAYVVDFGPSSFGGNKNIFSTTTPYLRNIKKTADKTWDAEVVKSTYDSLKKLKSITYEKTTITLETNSNGDDVINLSNANPKSEKWTRLYDGYVPNSNPYHAQPITCDGTESNTNDNMVTLRHYWRGNRDVTNFPITSFFYMPLNHSSATECHYQMKGEIVVSGSNMPLFVYFSHKPIRNETFTIIDNYSSMASVGTLDSGTALVNFEHSFNSSTGSGTIDVSFSGGKLIAAAKDVILVHSSISDTTISYLKLSFQLKD